MNIEIKKAEIKNRLFLAYNYIQKNDNVNNAISTKSDAPIHDDLRVSFTSLTPHLAFICEEITKKKAKDLIQEFQSDWSRDAEDENYNPIIDDFLNKFQVNGFETSGNGEKEGVKIMGSKFLDSGKSIALITPKQNFNDNDYPFSTELIELVDECRMEVFEYFKGKQAPTMQTEMEFEEDLENEAA